MTGFDVWDKLWILIRPLPEVSLLIWFTYKFIEVRFFHSNEDTKEIKKQTEYLQILSSKWFNHCHLFVCVGIHSSKHIHIYLFVWACIVLNIPFMCFLRCNSLTH